MSELSELSCPICPELTSELSEVKADLAKVKRAADVEVKVLHAQMKEANKREESLLVKLSSCSTKEKEVHRLKSALGEAEARFNKANAALQQVNKQQGKPDIQFKLRQRVLYLEHELALRNFQREQDETERHLEDIDKMVMNDTVRAHRKSTMQYLHHLFEMEKLCKEKYDRYLAQLQSTKECEEFKFPISLKKPILSVKDLKMDTKKASQDLDKNNKSNFTINKTVSVPSNSTSRSRGKLAQMLILAGYLNKTMPQLSESDCHYYVKLHQEETGFEYSKKPIPYVLRLVVKYVHQKMEVKQKKKETEEEPPEDECCICFELLTCSAVTTLEPCKHSFHTECIRSWFKEKRDCPFCRNFTILSDEYPELSRKK